MISRPNAGRGRRVEAHEPTADLLRRAAHRVTHLTVTNRASWLSEPLSWVEHIPAEAGSPLASLLRTIADEAEWVDTSNAAAADRARRLNDDGQTFIVHRNEVAHAVALARTLLGEDPT